MEVIIELLQIFKKEGLRSVGLVGSGNRKSLPEKFMLLVLEKQIWDDNTLAKKIYGTDKSDPKYRNLKKRVKRLLIDAIPNIDRAILGFTSEYDLGYYKCLQAINKVQMLSKKAAYETSLEIIAKNIGIAERFHLYRFLKEFKYHIIKINSIRGNTKVLQNESKKFLKYQREYMNEQEIYILLYTLLVNSVKRTKISEIELRNKKKVIEQMNLICQRSSSYEVHFWANYSRLEFCILSTQIGNLNRTLKAFEASLANFGYINPSRHRIWAFKKLAVLYKLKEFQKGIEYANQNSKFFTIQNNNWSLFKQYEFYHALNIDIDRAIKVYENFSSSDFYRLTKNKSTNQLWDIYNAYLQFMLQYTDHPKAKKFNLYKFINEVDIYSKDKPGYNFSIIAIELLFYLLWDDLDKYIDKMTALMAYRLRHLNTKTFQRSNIFAQLLLSVEQKKFDLEDIRSSGQKHYEYLRSLEDRLSINEWEIIGYDRLWEIALELLEKRLDQKKPRRLQTSVYQ